MHVSSLGYDNEYVPAIRIKGKWLYKAGFNIGDDIKVYVDTGKIYIVNNTLENIIEDNVFKIPSEFSEVYEGYLVSLRLERNSKYEPIQLTCSKDFYHFLRPMQHRSREILISVMLDGRMNVVGVYEVSKGRTDSASASPYEIIKAALLANSKSIVLAHNHTTGDPTPSDFDIMATTQWRRAAETLDIRLLDHIIIGHNRYVSLKDIGHRCLG